MKPCEITGTTTGDRRVAGSNRSAGTRELPWPRALAAAMAMACLPACMYVESEFEFSADGTVDAQFTLGSERGLMSTLMDDRMEEARREIRAKGFDVVNVTVPGYSAFRVTTNNLSPECANHLATDMGLPEIIRVHRGLFRTILDVDFSVPSSGAAGGIEGWFSRQLAKKGKFIFKLVFPTPPEKHNATKTELGGRRLVWELVPSSDFNVIRATFVAWHPWRIAGACALALAGAAFLLKRFWPRTKETAAPPAEPALPKTDAENAARLDSLNQDGKPESTCE